MVDQPCDLILASGTEQWLSSRLPMFTARSVICTLDWVSTPPGRNLFNLSWLRVSHSTVGGITDGWWFVGSSSDLYNNLSIPASYKRTLRTILSSTVPAVRVSAPPPSPEAIYDSVHYTSKVLHHGGLLPVTHAATARVCCPSVFTSSKWCVRTLTPGELSTAFDLPEAFATIFKSDFTGPTDQLPFLRAAPSKLLRAYYVHVIFPSCSSRLPGGGLGPSSVPKCANTTSTTTSTATTSTNTAGSTREGSSDPECEVATSTATENSRPMSASRLDDSNLHLLLNTGSSAAVEVNRQKAAKNDDAPVPTILWDRQLWTTPLFDSAVWQRAVAFIICRDKNPLDVLRNSFFLPLWRKRLWRSWASYFRIQVATGSYSDEDQKEDKAGAKECLNYASKCTWWEWKGGSKLFFWRWPEPIRQIARDGMRTCIKGTLPNYRVPQRKELDPEIWKLIVEKIRNVVEKGYIGEGLVKSLTSFFQVPKGEGDIRMVYDATKCGLNEVLWVPSFSLPDADNLLELVEEVSWMADIDIGEMFLNFPLDKFLQSYCGVDFGPYLPEVKSWLRWLRCAMGLKPSPYVAIRFLLFATEIIRGWKNDPKNALRYDSVRLNLPGMDNYNPRLPWVSKIITTTQRIASDFVGYVDDLRPIGESEFACNQCARRISCMLGYLGIQDASRKRQGASKASGVWAGSVVFADDDGVGVNCTQEKWDKAKGFLLTIQEQLNTGDLLDHKTLERIRGFLLYVTKTYPAMVPYLKGFHLTLDAWRPGRDTDGWRLTLAELREKFQQEEGFELEYASQNAKGAPESVHPSPRLHDDISTLLKLTAGESPPKRFVRSKLIVTACYGFGDASGSGFGSTISHDAGVRYRHGLWGRDINGKSSNYRELRNLVETIEDGVNDGTLDGAELFLFTDNTVAESAFYKGNTSSSKILFDLIVRLRTIEMTGSIKLWVIHVSGKRMIQQGADGLSRGNMLEGVMAGVPMLNFVPLSQSAIFRSPDIESWLSSWCNLAPQTLTPEDWFFKGHGLTGGSFNEEKIWIPTCTTSGLFVWSPPPAAARTAIDQLSISRHKRPSLTHVFVCPRLFTSLWRKRLYKLADCVFYIPAGSRSFWPATMFEPLIIGLLLPFSHTHPWQHRRSAEVLALEGQLRQVWSQPDGTEQLVLRKFFEL